MSKYLKKNEVFNAIENIKWHNEGDYLIYDEDKLLDAIEEIQVTNLNYIDKIIEKMECSMYFLLNDTYIDEQMHQINGAKYDAYKEILDIIKGGFRKI